MSNPRSSVATLALVLPLLLAGPATARLIGTLEEPVNGGQCAGIGNIRGWVYSSTGSELVQPFQVSIDGQKSIEVPCCGSRGDVSSKQAGAPARSGFSGVLNFGLLSPGSHKVSMSIQSRAGEKLTLETTCTSRRIGADPRLSDLDLDNDGAGYCESDLDDPSLICCEGVKTVGPGGAQICQNVCYRWDRAAQGLVMSAGPVLANPQCHSDD
ncbi:MAG: hypothetical protein P8R42_00420 [Candidatus Binatia bacterium]|nr:hypothetical protein [Candidatus Binatia bacterium]